MYLIIKTYGEHCSAYNRQTGGKEFIDTCQDFDEFKKIVGKINEPNFFEQPNGTVTDQQGEKIYDPENPGLFFFGDFSYTFVDPS